MNVSKFASCFMLQMDFVFFNVEIIHDFTSTFVAICSATLYPFVFLYRSKWPTLDILKFLVNTLMNQDNKFALIQVDKYAALARYFGFIKLFYNMNIIVQTTGGYTSSLSGNIYILNKTIVNIIRALMMNSIHK